VYSPYVPLLSFTHHKDVVTGVQWYKGESNYVLSCSKDCHLALQPITNAVLPQNDLATIGISWNSRNQVAVISDIIQRKQVKTPEVAPVFEKTNGNVTILNDASVSLTSWF
jgi:hypothetical protein